MIVDNTAFLEGTERSQVTRSKQREAPLEDDVDCWPSKKAKEKQPARYQGDMRIKLGGLIPVKDVYMPGRTIWCVIQSK